MVDDLALGGSQRAGAYRQVLELVCAQKLRLLSLYIKPAVLGRDLFHPLLVRGLHRLAPDIAEPQELPVLIDLAQLELKFALELTQRLRAAFFQRRELRVEHCDFRVALDDLEARVDNADAGG